MNRPEPVGRQWMTPGRTASSVTSTRSVSAVVSENVLWMRHLRARAHELRVWPPATWASLQIQIEQASGWPCSERALLAASVQHFVQLERLRMPPRMHLCWSARLRSPASVVCKLAPVALTSCKAPAARLARAVYSSAQHSKYVISRSCECLWGPTRCKRAAAWRTLRQARKSAQRTPTTSSIKVLTSGPIRSAQWCLA